MSGKEENQGFMNQLDRITNTNTDWTCMNKKVIQ